jgi:uncharacterized protein YodC (DUF2158 family)
MEKVDYKDGVINLNVGDVVVLTSGSPFMVVTCVLDSGLVNCCYFTTTDKKDDIMYVSFNHGVLNKVYPENKWMTTEVYLGLEDYENQNKELRRNVARLEVDNLMLSHYINKIPRWLRMLFGVTTQY